MIIGFSGYAQAGKSTAAQVLVDDFGFIPLSFAQPIKDALWTLNPLISVELHEFDGSRGVQAEQEHIYLQDLVQDPKEDSQWRYAKEYPETRRLLQVFGTEVGRQQFGEDFWVDSLFDQIDKDKNYVITDVRFPNEFWAVDDAGGLTIRIESEKASAANTHASETSLDSFTFDITVTNNGSLEDFKDGIVMLCTSLDLTQV